MSYITAKISPTPYTPALFIKQDREFNPDTMNRKVWLERQLINIEFAIFKYQGGLLELSNQAAQLDGKSDAAMWMQQVGVLALNLGVSGLSEASKGSTGTGSNGGFGEDFSKYSAIAGAALIAAGVVINIFKKKRDDKRLNELYHEAVNLGADVKMLESMRQRYQAELTRMKLLPILLFGAAAYIVRENN
ncbi:hypothetical protein [Dyadobacter sp. OTU695]|uniref:hypothetical protein n=1 Tax=Dyadobacter sp. OTU695 TaxID=3043860 RepID=UPI00313B582C